MKRFLKRRMLSNNEEKEENHKNRERDSKCMRKKV